MSQSISNAQVHARIFHEVNKLQRGAPFVIGVNGIDGSGKTVFSNGLAQFLEEQGRVVQVVHVDDFHNSKQFRYSGTDESENYYYRSIDFERLRRALLEPVVSTKKLDVEMVLLNLDTDTYTLNRRYVVNTETIVILEGVFIFRSDLLRYLDLKVFLEISFAESLRRALARDKQIQADETQERYRVKYHRGQELYFRLDDPKSVADIVINNEDYSKPVLVR